MDKIIIEANEDRTKAIVKYLNEETNTYDRQEVYKTTDKAFLEIARKYYEEKKQANPYYPHAIVEEHNAENSKILKTIALSSIITLGVVGILGMGGCFYYKGQLAKQDASDSKSAIELSIEEKEKEETKDTPDNTNDIPDNAEPKVEESTPVVEEVKATYNDLYQKTRFTTITNEMYESKVEEITKLNEEYGINSLTDKEIRLVVAMANSDHIVQTNEELASDVFSGTDVMDDMTVQGHFVGDIQNKGNNEGKYYPFYRLFIDRVDYEIAEADYNNYIAIANKYRIEETTPDTEVEISNAIHNEFVEKKWKDYATYNLSLGECNIPQTDGAAVITENLISGWYTDKSKIRYSDEVRDELIILSSVETHISNQMRILEGVCQSKVR